MVVLLNECLLFYATKLTDHRYVLTSFTSLTQLLHGTVERDRQT